MGFIDQRHAQKIAEWCEKYPAESKAYWSDHKEISRLYLDHKISFEEFKKRSDAIKEKYHFLEDA